MARLALAVLCMVAVSCRSAASVPDPPVEARAWAKDAMDCHVHYDRTAEGQGAAGVTAALGPIERACVLSPGYHNGPECNGPPCAEQLGFTQSANDWTIAEAKTADGHQLPFCGVPIGFEWAPAEVGRCLAAGGRGLKLHTERDHVDLTDPATAAALRAIIAAAAERGAPVLIHVRFDEPSVRAVFDIATALPKAQIVVAHQLGPRPQGGICIINYPFAFGVTEP